MTSTGRRLRDQRRTFARFKLPNQVPLCGQHPPPRRWRPPAPDPTATRGRVAQAGIEVQNVSRITEESTITSRDSTRSSVHPATALSLGHTQRLGSSV